MNIDDVKNSIPDRRGVVERQFIQTEFFPITDQKHVYYQGTMKPWHVSITWENHLWCFCMALIGSKGSSRDKLRGFGKLIPLGLFQQKWKHKHIAELCIDHIYTLVLLAIHFKTNINNMTTCNYKVNTVYKTKLM